MKQTSNVCVFSQMETASFNVAANSNSAENVLFLKP